MIKDVVEKVEKYNFDSKIAFEAPVCWLNKQHKLVSTLICLDKSLKKHENMTKDLIKKSDILLLCLL